MSSRLSTSFAWKDFQAKFSIFTGTCYFLIKEMKSFLFPLSLNTVECFVGLLIVVCRSGIFLQLLLLLRISRHCPTQNPAFFAAYILYGSVWRGFVSYGQLVCTEPLANPWPWNRQCHTRFLRSLIASCINRGRGVILHTLSHLSIKIMKIPCKKESLM